MFNYNVEFISGDIHEVANYISDVDDVTLEYDLDCSACTWTYSGKSVIWFDENTITIPIMIHELGHVVFGMMDRMGLELRDQEVFCYTQEYLIREVLKYIRFN